MRPVRVSVDVPDRREEVYDLLDVMANHELFNDHFLVDWTCTGPPSGVGSRARMRGRTAGRGDVIDIEVVSADPPAAIVEQGTGANGRRRTTGTYLLQELPGGGTRIVFELAWRRAPGLGRLSCSWNPQPYLSHEPLYPLLWQRPRDFSATVSFAAIRRQRVAHPSGS